MSIDILRRKSGVSFVVAMLFLLGTLSNSAKANETEDVGDVLRIAIPAAAFVTSLVVEDTNQGTIQFLLALGASQVVTEGMKMVIDKERPNGRSTSSMPSGHTSAAFAGASFIHRRYGWEYSIPAYIGAGFVGYSRIHADKHYVEDVLMGAAIGVASSFLIATPFENVTVGPMIEDDFVGVGLTIKW